MLQLQIKSVPRIYHISQEGIASSGPEDIFSFDEQVGFSANVIADFVNHRANTKVVQISPCRTIHIVHV